MCSECLVYFLLHSHVGPNISWKCPEWIKPEVWLCATAFNGFESHLFWPNISNIFTRVWGFSGGLRSPGVDAFSWGWGFLLSLNLFFLLQVSDSKYGSQLPNGSWNGMIGDLINKVTPEFSLRLIKVEETPTTAFSWPFIFPLREPTWPCPLSPSRRSGRTWWTSVSVTWTTAWESCWENPRRRSTSSLSSLPSTSPSGPASPPPSPWWACSSSCSTGYRRCARPPPPRMHHPVSPLAAWGRGLWTAPYGLFTERSCSKVRERRSEREFVSFNVSKIRFTEAENKLTLFLMVKLWSGEIL